MLTRLITADVVLFCSSIIVLTSGINLYIKAAKKRILITGLGIFIAFLECLVVTGIKLYEKSYFTFVIWILFMVFNVLTAVVSSKAFKCTKSVIDYLNKFPEYKEIADNLFVGYATFGDSMPMKRYYKERAIYKAGIKAFAELEFSIENEDVVNYQKKVRIMLISEMFLISLLIAWFLQMLVMIYLAWF